MNLNNISYLFIFNKAFIKYFYNLRYINNILKIL